MEKLFSTIFKDSMSLAVSSFSISLTWSDVLSLRPREDKSSVSSLHFGGPTSCLCTVRLLDLQMTSVSRVKMLFYTFIPKRF